MADCSLEEIIAAKLGGDPRRLSEVTLARLYSNHVATGTGAFTLLTVWREDESPETNRRNAMRLQHQLGSAQIGLSRLVARRTNSDGTSAAEAWVWAHGLRQETAIKLAVKFGQDRIGYSGRETGGDLHVLTIDAKTGSVAHVDRLGLFDAVRVATYFAQQGVVFDYVPLSWFEGVWMSSRGNLQAETINHAVTCDGP